MRKKKGNERKMKKGKTKKIIQNIIIYITLGILIWGCIEEYKDIKIRRMSISKVGDYETEKQLAEERVTEKQTIEGRTKEKQLRYI